MKATEGLIQWLLYINFASQRLVAVPNVIHWYSNGECDLLTVTKAMYTDEYEIKVSRSDFLSDKKKRKWRIQTRGRCANRFWYVCPEGLIKPEDLQEWMGLIYIYYNEEHENYRIRIIVKAQNRHSQKINERELNDLRIKMNIKYWWLLHRHTSKAA